MLDCPSWNQRSLTKSRASFFWNRLEQSGIRSRNEYSIWGKVGCTSRCTNWSICQGGKKKKRQLLVSMELLLHYLDNSETLFFPQKFHENRYFLDTKWYKLERNFFSFLKTWRTCWFRSLFPTSPRLKWRKWRKMESRVAEPSSIIILLSST